MNGSKGDKNKQTYEDRAAPLPVDPPSYEETMKHDKDEGDKTDPAVHQDSFARPVYTHQPHPRSHKGYPGAQTLTYASR
ncbi:YDR461C-A [Saccharomyces arboricola H-6]|uniref:YDR461C-A n=1 Tax=Saccharomyces arboricola (strain H-6 / AS 2.3317 / CBS 10644) TaxID=1160507 RepID=J8Q3K1_SACAR|nr:YDR461C-A [Saccharomyces arboricola H-6]